MLFSTLDSQKRPTFTIGPEKTINGSSVYTIHMELREGDLAANQNIRSSRGAASCILTFEMVLAGGRVQFCLSNSPAGCPRPIDKPASADQSAAAPRKTVYFDFWPRPPPSVPYSIKFPIIAV